VEQRRYSVRVVLDGWNRGMRGRWIGVGDVGLPVVPTGTHEVRESGGVGSAIYRCRGT
jgi:hypothetical protein